MIGLGSDAKVLVYTKPIDFRCGIDTLTALIQNQLDTLIYPPMRRGMT